MSYDIRVGKTNSIRQERTARMSFPGNSVSTKSTGSRNISFIQCFLSPFFYIQLYFSLCHLIYDKRQAIKAVCSNINVSLHGRVT